MSSEFSIHASEMPVTDWHVGDEIEITVKACIVGFRQESERVSLRAGTGMELHEHVQAKEMMVDLLVREVVA